jgi:hypothetical protein
MVDRTSMLGRYLDACVCFVCLCVRERERERERESERVVERVGGRGIRICLLCFLKPCKGNCAVLFAKVYSLWW